MNFPHFFIDRPIFAGVISIVITLVGVIALSTLPIAQYPDRAADHPSHDQLSRRKRKSCIGNGGDAN